MELLTVKYKPTVNYFVNTNDQFNFTKDKLPYWRNIGGTGRTVFYSGPKSTNKISRNKPNFGKTYKMAAPMKKSCWGKIGIYENNSSSRRVLNV